MTAPDPDPDDADAGDDEGDPGPGGSGPGDHDRPEIACRRVGVVHTPFSTTDEPPRQGFLGDAEGTVELDPEYAPGLAGVRAGEDIDVVWFADGADRVVTLDDERGVFATRSPARPNPICLTTCAVLAVEGRRLRVRGVDMRDGSPVLDLKRPIDPEREGGGRHPEE